MASKWRADRLTRPLVPTGTAAGEGGGAGWYGWWQAEAWVRTSAQVLPPTILPAQPPRSMPAGQAVQPAAFHLPGAQRRFCIAARQGRPAGLSTSPTRIASEAEAAGQPQHTPPRHADGGRPAAAVPCRAAPQAAAP